MQQQFLQFIQLINILIIKKYYKYKKNFIILIYINKFQESPLSKKQLSELSLYEKKEKCGLVPELPIGFTYNPGIFDKEKQKIIEGNNYDDNKLPKNTVSVPIRSDKSIVPPGKY